MKKYSYSNKYQDKKWLEFCKRIQQPYIIASIYDEMAIIRWDYTHFEKDIQKSIRSQARQINHLLDIIFIKYRIQGAFIEGTALVGAIKGIYSSDVDSMANEIFDLIVKYSNFYSQKLAQDCCA